MTSGVSSSEPVPEPGWQAIAVMYWRPPSSAASLGTVSAISSGWLLEFEVEAPCEWQTLARRLLLGAAAPASAYLLQNETGLPRSYHAAAFLEETLVGAMLVAPPPLSVDRGWLTARLGTPLDPGERFRLLDGRPSGASTPRTSVVCVCCQVGDSQIVEAVKSGTDTLAAIAAATRAGTNCGRCRPRISALLESAASPRSG